mmetsp:Transcript_4757/g.7311  ORF Transcript_4757/g.7311 Transcript_4757/m.7311 type:complete len:830 (-) Transcript_4757:98-2587(-)
MCVRKLATNHDLSKSLLHTTFYIVKPPTRIEKKNKSSMSNRFRGSSNRGGFWKPGGFSSTLSNSVVLNDSGTAAASEESTATAAFNFQTGPLSFQRQSLPIAKHRRQILYALEKYPVVIIVGETGSGKSTQIPQYLYENGWADDGFRIGCTQPRRIAAQTLAARVSEEVGDGSSLRETVGYAVRFDDCTSPSTGIAYLTDGMLLREATMSDPLLSRYSVIMIDEAHERNLNTDALLGIIKKIRRKRKGLRVIVCSATIDAEAFLNFFVPPNKKKAKKKNNADGAETVADGMVEASEKADQSKKRKRKSRWGHVNNTTQNIEPGTAAHGSNGRNKPLDHNDEENEEKGVIISIDGRQHPVDVMYVSEPVPDYVIATVDTALRIHIDESDVAGDILCFLPSGEDVDVAIQMAEDTLPSIVASSMSTTDTAQRRTGSKNENASFLPLYGTLPHALQARIFQPRPPSDRNRRIIFATNIAETSVTVPNITHVVDCGFAKIPYFDPETGFDRLIVRPISRASARQRAGRAGRIKAGKCYRLYSEEALVRDMESSTPPEVLRTNLTSFLLTLKALGVHNVLAFDLMSLPSVDALSHGLECLYALDAIDDMTNLTSLGNDMAEFPTDPRVSKMLLESIVAGCAPDVLSVAATMQVSRGLFYNPKSEKRWMEFDSVMEDIMDRSGDHVTAANLLRLEQRVHLTDEDCRERFVNRIALQKASEVRGQLARCLRRYGKISQSNEVDDDEEFRSRSIRKCITSGFFFNAARLGNDGQYYTLRGGHMVTISSSSVLSRHGAADEYILFAETGDGSKGGIDVRNCTSIEGRWLRELAPHYWA